MQITLRYHLVFNSSRSCIGDSAAHNQGACTPSVILPLYKKGVEKERFQRAFIWLGRDVHQILIFMGLEYESKKNLLYNVNKIFTCYSSTEKLAL
jgi:UV radiation resistance-associated gene protein